MKKILSVILAVVLVFALGVTVMANSNQLPSPMGGSPRLSSFTVDGDCDATIIVTPYAYKNTLPSELLSMMDKAYAILLAAEDLNELIPGIKELAEEKGIDPATVGVNEIFDIRYEGCYAENDHNGFTITLDSDAFKGFVALVHYHGTSWEIIEATVSGNTITFYASDFSPFAIVVDTTGESPKTGDSVMIISTIVLSVSVIALGVVTFKRKKQIAQ